MKSKKQKSIYGYCYDKAGNLKIVFPPFYANGKVVKPAIKKAA